MALEIERRFLVRGDQWRTHVAWQAQLQQGYLSAAAEGFTTRVRSNGAGGAWLTLKAARSGCSDGRVRHEFEYAIPAADAEDLMTLAVAALRKCRYGLDLPGGDWVLDVFQDGNTPLVIAEVELASPEQPVAIPTWCVQEITGQGRFSNAALAAVPLSSWPPDAVEPVLALLKG